MDSRISSRLTYALVSWLVLTIFVPQGMAQANVTGQWSTLPYVMPINPIHVALLSSGNVLVVAGSGNCPPSQSGCPSGPPYGPSNNSGALLLNPVTGAITQFSLSWDMFCNGMVLLQDGTALIDGGTIQYTPFLNGQPQVAIFDPATNTFTNTANMADGRWYPNLTTLGDGSVMAFSGMNEVGGTNTSVEFYTIGLGWSQQYLAGWTPPLYPRMHLLPNGNVFYSGPGTSSALFDPATTTWTLDVANTNYPDTRKYGTSVLLPLTPANNYDPMITIMGGNNPATNTTEIIDMGAATPKWVYGLNMSEARIEMNAVILPNGEILAVGGSVNDESTHTLSLNADLFNLNSVNLNTNPPNLGTVSSAGANATERLYHSVALLLPDATVWLAGGNPDYGKYNNTMEIYQPPYLFNSNGGLATRPSITSAPSSITYGKTFTVQTPDASTISSVVLVRNGAVTHAFGMDQRLVGMNFSVGSGSLTVTAPPNGNIAPPGYYMLFILNSSGVPSVAQMVQLLPMVSSVLPNNGPTTGGTAVTITGTNFAAGATVTFGGTAATNVVVVNSTTITATTPAHAAGAVTVTVTVNGQSGSLVNGFTYTAAGISFIQVASATPSSTATVSVTYPAAQTSGDLNIVVVGWNDTVATVQSVKDSAGNSYSLAIGPTKGTKLQQSIYYAANIVGGSNTVTVTFNQTAADPDIRILEYRGVAALDAKAGASGSSTTANSGSATTTSANELIFGADMVATTTGAAGSGFTSRIITSRGDIAEDKVVTTAGSNSATATLDGSGPWVMQMATFSATSGPAPTVTSVSPNNGSTTGGTAVTITGTNFAAGATVTFGGTAATNVVVVNSTTITATTPAHAAGAVTVTVTVNGQSGSLVNGFTYTAAGISFIQVASATPSSTATVSVTYPAAQTSGDLNIVVVGWNDTVATVQSVKDSAGNSYSLAIGPTKGTKLQQSIYYAANIVGGSNTVTVTFNQTAADPDIRILEYRGVAALDAKAGASGSSTTANSGSATTTSANELIFGADMVATTTGAAGSGFTSRIITSRGDIAEDKVVTTAGSNSATATLDGSGPWVMQMATFSATSGPAPTVTSVSPNNGSTTGGTAVTITGTNFAAGATVTFGGTAATNVVVVNSTTITATTPAHAAGAVTVTVTVNGQSGSLVNGFTYTAAGISFIQVASATPSSTATVSVTYPAAQTSGDLNIVVVGWNDTVATVQSVKDSAGNSYSLAIGPTKGTKLQQSIYYAANIVGGSNTVTVTFNQTAADPDIRILEYRGVAALDAKAGASGSSTTANSGSATTTSANELIFGADMVATTTGAAGSGFTSRIITSRGDIAEDKVVTTAGSNSATATLDGSGPWVMQMATFK